MRTYMVIPTYWSGPKGEWKEGDAVYDHATPLNEEGTLLRTLQSLSILEDKHFTLIIIAAVTNDKYLKVLEEKMTAMLASMELAVDTILFTESNMQELKRNLYKNLDLPDILQMRGYSNIRNLCLLLPYILDAELAVLIDDDEVFEDPEFMSKAKEFIGKRFFGNTIDGVAGYYLNEDNEYYDKVNIVPWMTYWDRFGGKSEAFDKIIGSQPRLKKTPFAFGGAMVIHRNLMRIVPFDPKINRGEDTDYVINSRIFGFNFYLDNQLSIKHLPPEKNHPIWKRFREDIFRFLYDKSKFETQSPRTNLHKIEPADFDPYPGQFMKPDLGDKIFKTNIILALNYLANGDVEACKETINNIYLARYDAVPHYNTYDEYLKFQKNWRHLLEHTKQFGNILKIIILKGQIIKHDKYNDEKKMIIDKYGIDKDFDLHKIALFKDFNNKELRLLLHISQMISLKKNDFVFRDGDIESNIYIVLQGKLNVLKSTKNSQETVVISEIGENEHFNETSIFYDSPHKVSIRAVTNSILMRINRKNVLKILEENHELAAKLLWEVSKTLSNRLMQTTKKVVDSKDEILDVSDDMQLF